MPDVKLTYTQQQVQWWLRASGVLTADELATRTGRALGAVLNDLAGMHEFGMVRSAIVPGSSLWWITPTQEEATS